MNIRIISVGKTKEKYLTMAIQEYTKRLGAYCRLEFFEVKDEKVPDKLSDQQRIKAIETEGKLILSCLRDHEILATLEINGIKWIPKPFLKKLNPTESREKARSHLLLADHWDCPLKFSDVPTGVSPFRR